MIHQKKRRYSCNLQIEHGCLLDDNLAGYPKNNLDANAASNHRKNRWFFIFKIFSVTGLPFKIIGINNSKKYTLKKLLFTAFIAGSLIACNSASTDADATKDSINNQIENTTDSLQNKVDENADSAKARLEKSSDSVKNQVNEAFDKKDSLMKH